MWGEEEEEEKEIEKRKGQQKYEKITVGLISNLRSIELLFYLQLYCKKKLDGRTDGQWNRQRVCRRETDSLGQEEF